MAVLSDFTVIEFNSKENPGSYAEPYIIGDNLSKVLQTSVQYRRRASFARSAYADGAPPYHWLGTGGD